MSRCFICDGRVLRHSRKLTCCVCQEITHLRCLPIESQLTPELFDVTNHTDWLCIPCTSALLPFDNIINDVEFMVALSESWIKNNSFSSLMANEQQFNPFQWNDVNEHCPLFETDPDIQFLNNNTFNENLSSCNYYVEEMMKKKCQQQSIDNSNFSVFHLNVRSLPKHFTELESYLNGLPIDFSVIGLTETWLNESTADIYNMQGYQNYNNYRTGRRGGGVSLYIKEGLNSEIRNDLNLMDPSMEALFIEIPNSNISQDKNVIVGVLYRPPNTDINVFNELLSDKLSMISQENKLIYLMGDFNINILEHDLHVPTSEFVELMYSYLIFPTITKPTRIKGNSATLIDNIFCNDLDNRHFSGILYCDISDHYPVFSINYTSSINEKPTTIRYRTFSDANINYFSEELGKIDWSFVYNVNDGKEAFQGFIDKYVSLYNNCFPEKTKKVSYKNRKPWLTVGLKAAIKTKNKLYMNSKKFSTQENVNQYKQYKTHLNKIMKLTERNYYSNLLEDNKKNIKNLWCILKGIINKRKSSHSGNKFKINGTDSTDKNKIANGFNKYFVNVGKDLAKNISSSNIDPNSYIEQRYPQTIFLETVLNQEVKQIITNLKDTSAGYDGINSNILKKTYVNILDTLTYILNLSIEQGFFPDCLKIAKVIPLYKSGDAKAFSNYRPVSVLPVFSKILERLMYNRMIKFINKNNILYQYQFGFRQNRSTNMALITLVDKISSAIDNGECVIGVFIDLRKAFDTVDHNILISKLNKYGFRGLSQKWLNDYLSNRQQFVQYNETTSVYQSITCGVPQGSILGPLLFILYVNDIANVSKSLFLLLFADDTNIFIKGKSINEMIEILNNEMTKVTEWMNVNRLSLNVQKTHYIIFKSQRKQISLDKIVKINGIRIEQVKHTKFLGVIIDENLTWSEHIKMVKSKVSRGFGIICKTRKVVPLSTLVTLYNSLIYPHLIYCIEIWGNAAGVYQTSLFNIQKKIVRVIKSASYRSDPKPIFIELKIMPLDLIYKYNTVVTMYKFVKGELPKLFKNMFKFNHEVVQRYIRHNDRLFVPQCKTTLYQNTIKFQGVIIWNTLTEQTDHKCCIYTFKKRLKNCIMIQYNNA